MQSLKLTKLCMYPRVSKSISKSLEINQGKLKFEEYLIDISPKMFKIQQMLIKLIQECLDELKREFTKIPKIDHVRLN